MARLLCIEYIPGCNILNSFVSLGNRLPFDTLNFVKRKMNKETIDYTQFPLYNWAFNFDSAPGSFFKK